MRVFGSVVYLIQAVCWAVRFPPNGRLTNEKTGLEGAREMAQ